MFWILMVMGLLVAIVLALVVGGLVTPREHVATRSQTYRATPAQVWAAVRDVASYASWREDMIDVEMVQGSGDAPAVQWREISSGGTVTFGITEEEPPVRMVARVLDDDLPWGGTWTWEVSPAPEGARLTITERGYVNNPIFRFIGTHFIGFNKTIDSYLRALGTHLKG
jgi:hypothetical protein